MKFNRNKMLAALFFGSQVRQSIYEKLSAMLGHGVGLTVALEQLLSRYRRRKNPLTSVLEAVLSELRKGGSLAEALAPFIPGEEAMLIRSGLDSGDLPNTLRQSAELLSARRTIVRSLVEALQYPVLLFGLFLVMLLVLSRYVVPQLAELSNPILWEGGARVLYSVASFIDSPAGLVVLVSLFLFFVAALVSLPHFTGPVRVVCDRFPPWSFYRLIVGAIWLYTIASMMRAGIQVSVALDSMAKQEGTSRWLRERLLGIRAGLDRGSDLGTALQDTGHDFPDRELVEDVAIYSTLPGFEDRIQVIAEEWLQSGTRKVKSGASLLNMICILGILMLLIGVGLAVSSIQQQIGQSAF